MQTILKITIASTDPIRINGAISLLEAIKKDHPNLFQQIEMIIDC